MKIKMGDEYTDIITGFTGVVTGIVSYITGCDQVLLTPRVSDGGAKVDAQWFDDKRVEPVKNGRSVRIDNSDTTRNGACDPAPVK